MLVGSRLICRRQSMSILYRRLMIPYGLGIRRFELVKDVIATWRFPR